MVNEVIFNRYLLVEFTLEIISIMEKLLLLGAEAIAQGLLTAAYPVFTPTPEHPQLK